MIKIILASTSPRRKELLKQIGLKFTAVSSDFREDMTVKMKPINLAKKLSRGKAEAVAKKYRNHLIIAADTFIAHNNKVLGKPHTAPKAIKTLQQISGQCLSVISGITIIDTNKNKTLSQAVSTKVFIKKLTPQEIKNYVASGEPLDKAGAFGIQGLGSLLIKKISGDYSNVVGLPLTTLAEMLKKFGVKIL